MAARRRSRVLVVASAVGLLAVLAPAFGAAQCGSADVADAHKDVGRGRPPLAIGDSVMLLAVDRLADVGYRVHARGCLTFLEAIGVVKQQKSAGELGRLVVIAAGANAGISMAEIREVLQVLGGKDGEKRILGLVVPRESGGGTSSHADVVREAGSRYKNRVKLFDWVEESSGHPEYFSGDGLHLSYPGADAYTSLFKRGLRWASWQGDGRWRNA